MEQETQYDDEDSARISLDQLHPAIYSQSIEEESTRTNQNHVEIVSPDLTSSPPPVLLQNDLIHHDHDTAESLRSLREELEVTRAEKSNIEAQYSSLLGKLTTMRSTLGDKLKQDADELDLRGGLISNLEATNDELLYTIETLKSELIQSHEDADHVHSELEQLRSRAFDSQKSSVEEVNARERSLREAQEDLERVRMEREEWEGEAMRERVRREEVVARLSALEFEYVAVKEEREMLRDERDREAESASNLNVVLEEFTAAKERELKATSGDLELQLRSTHQSLSEYKQRAISAENQLSAAQNDSEKVSNLSKEVQEKNLIIGKLRHEAVISNEHLTEALRRLKKDSNENSVDRRLVSNVLITFLNTPRADTKRFEMLQLLSSILSWTDDQREQVGLQKSVSGPTASSPTGVIAALRSRTKGHARSSKGKAVEDGLGENETFSALWIEFLLREVQGSNAAGSALPSANSPTSSINSYDPSAPPPLSAVSGGSRRYSFDRESSPTSSTSSSSSNLPPLNVPRRASLMNGLVGSTSTVSRVIREEEPNGEDGS